MALHYEWLQSVGDKNTRVNRVVALNRLPFLSSERAIAFVTKHFPEMTPDHKPIKVDPERAAKIATISQYEVEYILKELETVKEELQALVAKQRAKCDELESTKHNDLFDEVELTLAKDRLKEYANMTSGVIQAEMRVLNRLYELHVLAGKNISNWRI